MDSVDDTEWVASLGRYTSHVTGPLATLNRLGVVCKAPKKHTGHRVVRLGQQLKVIQSGDRATRATLMRLCCWVRFADDVESVIRTPRTCADWVDLHRQISQICTTHKVFAKVAGYLCQWTIRARLLAAMHVGGVRQLGGLAGVSPSDFACSFPDSNNWFDTLRRPGMCDSLQSFFSYVEYDGRPELFSMFACLLLTSSMRHNPSWFKAHSRALRRSMHIAVACDGVMKLPAVCVAETGCVRRLGAG